MALMVTKGPFFFHPFYAGVSVLLNLLRYSRFCPHICSFHFIAIILSARVCECGSTSVDRRFELKNRVL